MNTNIFIPSKINVGFQNREGTYTGKLAYVIYFDEKGKLRKEASWSNWRDKNIPNQILDNEPTEGFVLNKKVGGDSSGWNYRQTYTRVYDPRGFEFEISVPNLLWILENCDCTRGKGLEGKFVYGWDKTDLVLVPVESPDYKEIQRKNEVVHNNLFIKAKDLVVGATYETLGGEQLVYMGKYDIYESQTNNYYNIRWGSSEYKWTYPLDETWFDDIVFRNSTSTKRRFVNKGKEFWFVMLGRKDRCPFSDQLVHYKSVTRKFSRLITTSTDKYAEYYDMMQHDCRFSPIDFTKSKILPVPFEDFKNAFVDKINRVAENNYPRWLKFCVMAGDIMFDDSISWYPSRGQWVYNDTWNNHRDVTLDNLQEIYDFIKPVYGEQYLMNGNLCVRRGYLGTEK